jgi:hypothetical protein
MKSAICDLCGQVLYGMRPPGLIINPNAPLDPDREVQAELMMDLSEFDILAGRMAQHIGERHPQHQNEMAAVGFLAAKVYAMTWTSSQTPEFDALRESWRKVFLEEMTKQRARQTGAPAMADSSTAPAGTPAGSYEKKSERNVSI